MPATSCAAYAGPKAPGKVLAQNAVSARPKQMHSKELVKGCQSARINMLRVLTMTQQGCHCANMLSLRLGTGLR